MTSDRGLWEREKAALLQENARLRAQVHRQAALAQQLTRIRRTLTRRAPVHQVLEVVVQAASELLGDEIVGLRRVDPADPTHLTMTAWVGVDARTAAVMNRCPVGEGAGGRAYRERRVIVMESYRSADHALSEMVQVLGLDAAMAAPVFEDGLVVGSLAVATSRPGRTYDAEEQALLVTFAEHASLALTDAATAARLDAALSQATYDALHDPLTGLGNRVLLAERLQHALDRRGGGRVGVVCLDLDGFSHVNDSLGHYAGDRLLKEVAERLTRTVRAGDTVVRLGGDEFAVVVEDLPAADDEAQIEIDLFANRLLECLQEPVEVAGQLLQVSAGAGVVLQEPSDDGQALLRNADLALYQAKSGGRGRLGRFEPSLHVASLHRLHLEQELRSALENDELVLHYQPVVDLSTGLAVGAEALARWTHPTLGQVSPTEFVPVAEATGLSGALAEWAVRTACADLAAWRGIGGVDEHFSVGVNVAAGDVEQPDLLRQVERALSLNGLGPRSLVIEITESAMVGESPQVQATLQGLAALGVMLAVDDFGTGHASLDYLRRFPIEILKLDKSFTVDLSGSAEDSALPRAVLRLARSLGLRTVAEGVETAEHLRAVRRRSCDMVQGFLLARPVPADQLLATLPKRVAPRPVRRPAARP